MSEENESYYLTLRDAASKVRAIAYLMESHDQEILSLLDMEDAWTIVGKILDELGCQIVDVARNMEEEEVGAAKAKKRKN